jgi:hypothetical protein
MSASALCSHGGRVIFVPNTSVMLSGAPAASGLPVLPIAGCPILTTDVTVAPLPSSYTKKVLSRGMPLLLMTMTGPAAASGGPVMCISAGQTKVLAT